MTAEPPVGIYPIAESFLLDRGRREDLLHDGPLGAFYRRGNDQG